MSRLKGVKQVNANFKRLTAELSSGAKARKAMHQGLILIQGYAGALTPIDTSSLINSQYRVVTNTATGTKGIVGYTANYAPYVHEASGKTRGEPRGKHSRGMAWDPAGEPEFLVKGAEEAKPEMIKIIAREHKI